MTKLSTGMQRVIIGKYFSVQYIFSYRDIHAYVYHKYSDTLNTFKDICGYFQCAPFPRLQTGKVVWVLSFDP